MFKESSMTGTGIAIITILEVLFPIFQIDIPKETITSGVLGIISGIGFLLAFWGQVRRKDLAFGIFRKP